MQSRLRRKLVIDALKMATGSRHVGSSLLCHSDRGSQYASGDYHALLAGARVARGTSLCSMSLCSMSLCSMSLCIMSRKGDCWDNAPVESFTTGTSALGARRFATLKVERVYHRRYKTREEARADLFQYLEVWQGRKRRHSSLGYLSPADYETRFVSQGLSMAA